MSPAKHTKGHDGIQMPTWVRNIKIKVNRRFDVSNIILKIEVVYSNVKVVMREMKIFNI